ncbi:MAG: histidinol-phosphate transaminase [Actinomycetota bacterium]|nr:histidinol-phosphate transaminase [Actinomycetota bacterium]
MSSGLPIRPELRGRSPYGAPQSDVAVRLNTNENNWPLPEGLPEAIATAVGRAAGGLNRYPDRDALALRAELADYLGHDLTPAQVWAANGSNEILQQILQAFGGAGRSALGFTPSYSMHPLISLGTGTMWHDGPREADFRIDPDAAVAAVRRLRPDVVFVTSPNNPTGTAVSLGLIRAVYGESTGMVIVDEAYAEFARPGTPSALQLLPGRERLVVTRTMSKAFGMAGLRLGYLAGDPRVVEAVQLVRLPYHLSTLTQTVARVALSYRDPLLATVRAVCAQRDRITAALPGLGLTAVPSDANFVFVGGFPDSCAAWRALLEMGVLVRDLDIPGYLRITAGTPEETDALLAALRSWRAAMSAGSDDGGQFPS